MDKTLLLQSHGLKATPQRLEIVAVLSNHGHINIDALYKELKKNFPSLSLSTVYKNINTMIKKGFLLEVKVPAQKNIYELIKDEHSHVVCTKCNDVIDVHLDTSDLLIEAKNISKYDFDASSIVLNGTCPRCS